MARGQLTAIDNDLCAAVMLQFRSVDFGFTIKDQHTVRFQFPPRFISDSRKGDWVEGPLRGDEPVAVFATSGPREIALTWTYIAGAVGGSGNNIFTTVDVAREVRALRSYFSRQSSQISLDEELIIYFRCWHHTGPELFTCRMKSVDISHGKAIINPSRPTQSAVYDTLRKAFVPTAKHAYALRTDVTAELRLWTKVGSASAVSATMEQAGGRQAGDDPMAQIDLQNLYGKVPVTWQ